MKHKSILFSYWLLQSPVSGSLLGRELGLVAVWDPGGPPTLKLDPRALPVAQPNKLSQPFRAPTEP